MIKKTLLLLLSILALSVSAQNMSVERLNAMSDKELLEYVKQYESQGLSIDTMIQLAKDRGASEADIAKVKTRIEGLSQNTLTPSVNKNIESETETKFGYTKAMREEILIDNLPQIFGSSFFKNPKISAEPALNLATPKNYQLGPGDEISISLYGAANNTYETSISKEGTIRIESLSPIYLSGKSISEAKLYLERTLAPIYDGLTLVDNQEGKVSLGLSLIKMRSILVSIVGQASVPGNYTLNGATSTINAIFAAGGINKLGSYRNITLIRNNKTIAEIDLYDFLVKGVTPNISLRDQDVLLVPYAEKQIEITGGFKNIGIFELRETESLKELLSYSGGFLASANKESISIERFKNGNIGQESVFRTSYKDYIPMDGDKISTQLYDTYVSDRVSISGAVNVPGSFNVLKASNVFDLIELAEGVTEYAVRETALLYRTENGKEKLLEALPLSKILSKEINYSLKEGDRLDVLSEFETNALQFVNIQGSVQKPGSYPFYKGMSPLDLIYLAGGLQFNANPLVSVYSKGITPNGDIESMEVDISKEILKLPKLKENDILVVRNISFKEISTVSISGPVLKAGAYGLTKKMSLLELINKAGGLLEIANENGIYIRRRIDLNTLEIIKEKSVNDSLKVDENVLKDPYIDVAVDFKNASNINLKIGDIITISEKDNSITVQGAVNQETAFNFKKQTTLKAIKKAGGFLESAQKRGVYVIYANKSIQATNSFLFIKSYPPLKPGATVIVPAKNNTNNKLSTQELLGITSGISTLGILIRTLLGF